MTQQHEQHDEAAPEPSEAPEGVVVPETPSEVTEDTTTGSGSDDEGHTSPVDEPMDDSEPTSSYRKLRRENQAMRDRAKTAESEVERLAATVASLQSREVARLAEGHGLAAGADLLREVELAEVLGEDGTPDPDKVAAAAAEVLEANPHWRSKFVPRGAPDYAAKPEPGTPEWSQWLSGLQAGATGDLPAPEQATWGSVLGR